MLLCSPIVQAPLPVPPAEPPAGPPAGSNPLPGGDPAQPGQPLSVDELLALLRQRWQVSYDLQVVQRRGRVYLQVMWAYLEQQSFPLSPEAYRAKVEDLVVLLNGLGVAGPVRDWLTTTPDKPRLGRAMQMALEIPPGRATEFLL